MRIRLDRCPRALGCGPGPRAHLHGARLVILPGPWEVRLAERRMRLRRRCWRIAMPSPSKDKAVNRTMATQRRHHPHAISNPTSAALIERAWIASSSSQKVLGARLKVTRARISRIVHGARLSIANCIHLAALLDEDPAVVLDAYQYTDIASTLRSAYTRRGCAIRERWCVHEALDRLGNDDRLLVKRLIDRLLAAEQDDACNDRNDDPGAFVHREVARRDDG